METTRGSPELEPLLLPIFVDAYNPRRTATAAVISVGVHVVLIFVASFLSFDAVSSRRAPVIHADLRRATPLIAPPPPQTVLTQPQPNRRQPAKELDLAGLLPRPSVNVPDSAPPGRPFVPAPAPSRAQAPKTPEIPEPRLDDGPKFTATASMQPQIDLPGSPLPAPPPAKEKPKLAFESPASFEASRQTGPVGRNVPPRPTVEDAIRGVTSGAGGATQVVGDIGAGGGGAGPGMQSPGSSSRPQSSLELLSDPKGVDFRPYLIQVLTAVRRNWFAVIPESARFGRRGKTQIQFAISRDGRVPKLVISLPSGTDSLDRAAVAGISASNPFPPLPAHFPSEQIRLQLTFAYNPQ